MAPIDYNARIARNRAAWTELFALADNGDLCGFFDRYVRYLTDCGVYSRERATLRDACALASVLIRRRSAAPTTKERSSAGNHESPNVGTE